MRGCLSMVAGALIGVVFGGCGCAAAMSLAGGGRSHNDMFTWTFATALCGMVGGMTAPTLTSRVLGIRERRRMARAVGATAQEFPRAFALYLLGAVIAAFSAATLFYYSYAIAELSPDAGGPQSDIPGEIRGRVTLIGSIVAAAAALFLFVRALKSEPAREKMGDEGQRL